MRRVLLASAGVLIMFAASAVAGELSGRVAMPDVAGIPAAFCVPNPGIG